MLDAPRRFGRPVLTHARFSSTLDGGIGPTYGNARGF
jgi:hypothetical protein